MASLLLLLLPAGLITVFVLAGYGFGRLGRVGLRHADTTLWLRSASALLIAGAAAVYTWGLLHVAGAVVQAEDGGTNSSPMLPCRSSARAESVIDYTVDYVPLQFVCLTSDAGRYDSRSVPGYVNPVALTLALAGVVVGSALALGSGEE
ncbi:hypothetical protein [Streptomyces corynorhini]|uniref:Uncharacterized protein n=1 Tax=Streptomyces corynorhini TaxID=2282652 RepID=A0A370BED8_9ACTN|nr:hypothetical protein [Streptomyces corynorhini]RDG39042.1 hypothetical protein DVH02_06075 [Streptomyces corynorhini]